MSCATCMITQRIWNRRAIDYSTMQYAMFLIMRDVRHKSAQEISATLTARLAEEKETFASNDRFSLHGMNGRQIHHVLARMTEFIEIQSGMASRYADYIVRSGKNGYEVEHSHRRGAATTTGGAGCPVRTWPTARRQLDPIRSLIPCGQSLRPYRVRRAHNTHPNLPFVLGSFHRRLATAFDLSLCGGTAIRFGLVEQLLQPNYPSADVFEFGELVERVARENAFSLLRIVERGQQPRL